jgi:DNA polymerase III subunit gamma/tau
MKKSTSENETAATPRVALYRKYRPHAFDEVRGQDHIVTALSGALKKGAIPHALLFAGPRGTGKTSVARIFAREIGTAAIDTYEIDAASNRGIDDIRELREAVHTMPFESARKVYIIDEVHMLTKEAFNALLKTLEEPPAHVVFILATTEIEKLPETILSRCQVFIFKAPTKDILREAILNAAKGEHFTLSLDAANLIAVAADGAFRDALGITEKVIMASADTTASADEVAAIIGAPKKEILARVLSALHEKDVDAALTVVGEIEAHNLDMKVCMRMLLERVRAVMLSRHSAQDAARALAQFDEDEQVNIKRIAKEAKSPVNSAMLVRLIEATEMIGRTAIATLPLEIAVIDLCVNKSQS